jgi:hypothetical protein
MFWQKKPDKSELELKLKETERKLKEAVERVEELEKENYFDFSSLWEEGPETGLIKYVPVMNAVLLVITMLVVIFKK